ncbi:MAG: hypothetical protein ABI682_09685 [Acidobacteriota bacterium]
MVNRENVFPFCASPRTSLARRGAPDKSRAARADAGIECPECEAPLRLAAPAVPGEPDLFCESCETVFSIFRGEAAAD